METEELADGERCGLFDWGTGFNTTGKTTDRLVGLRRAVTWLAPVLPRYAVCILIARATRILTLHSFEERVASAPQICTILHCRGRRHLDAAGIQSSWRERRQIESPSWWSPGFSRPIKRTESHELTLYLKT